MHAYANIKNLYLFTVLGCDTYSGLWLTQHSSEIHSTLLVILIRAWLYQLLFKKYLMVICVHENSTIFF
jgi:hypothetical protein